MNKGENNIHIKRICINIYMFMFLFMGKSQYGLWFLFYNYVSVYSLYLFSLFMEMMNNSFGFIYKLEALELSRKIHILTVFQCNYNILVIQVDLYKPQLNTKRWIFFVYKTASPHLAFWIRKKANINTFKRSMPPIFFFLQQTTEKNEESFLLLLSSRSTILL